MPHALLICGDSLRFTVACNQMRRHFTETLGVAERRVTEVRTAYRPTDDVHDLVRGEIRRTTKVPLLLLYSGHGSVAGWAIDDTRRVRYGELAHMLANAGRPVLVVNDCCHSAMLHERLVAGRVDPKLVQAIAACEGHRVTHGGLTPWLIERWNQRSANPFRSGRRRPENALNWGGPLEHEFFAPEAPKEKAGKQTGTQWKPGRKKPVLWRT